MLIYMSLEKICMNFHILIHILDVYFRGTRRVPIKVVQIPLHFQIPVCHYN